MDIALILPNGKSDYLANTVIDGLIDLSSEDSSIFFTVTQNYPSPFDLTLYEKNEDDFTKYAQNADIIILAWGKNSTNFLLAEKINQWQKTVFIDGSELGKNNRFDESIQKALLDGTYKNMGAIDQNMLSKCKLYFRRERPYIHDIIPFPFGIEKRYRKFFNGEQDFNKKRDIDFTCIFGQDEYPILRRQAREYLEIFCKKNGFVCQTKKTKGFNFDDNTKHAGRDHFYEILSRTKVGISVGGGGFDTARFWEILANDSLLLTEKIAIYNEGTDRLNYKRITQFNDLEDFKVKLDELGTYIKNGYDKDQAEINKEYLDVIENHSTKSRVKEIIKTFQSKHE